jgi:hypothetical protein
MGWAAGGGGEDLSFRAEDAGHGFGFGVDVEFAVNIADMGTDGANADAVFVGDLFIAKAVDEGVEDLVLADRQAVVFDEGGGRGLEGVEDAAGDVSGHRGAAMVKVENGLDDFDRGRLL